MDQSRWPDQVNLLNEHNEEIQKEIKANKEHVLLTATEQHMADVLLEKATLKKAKRVISWCFRFVENSKSKMLKAQRKVGPLTMEDVERANNYLRTKAQDGVDLNNREAKKLGLTMCNDGIAMCVGRIQGEEPIFIPRESLYATKVCEEKHSEVGHTGVDITMAKIREKYWIPRLRTILKKEKRKCESARVCFPGHIQNHREACYQRKGYLQNIPLQLQGSILLAHFILKKVNKKVKVTLSYFHVLRQGQSILWLQRQWKQKNAE